MSSTPGRTLHSGLRALTIPHLHRQQSALQASTPYAMILTCLFSTMPLFTPAIALNPLSNPSKASVFAKSTWPGDYPDEHYPTGDWRQEFFFMVATPLVVVEKFRYPF
jgi:hypothetical protein